MVVNVSSTAGIKGYAYIGAYVASACGVRGFAEAAAMRGVASFNPMLPTSYRGAPSPDRAVFILPSARVRF